MNVALSGAYTHHVKTLRDAVRTWDAITPSVPAHSVSRRYSTSFLKKKIMGHPKTKLTKRIR